MIVNSIIYSSYHPNTRALFLVIVSMFEDRNYVHEFIYCREKTSSDFILPFPRKFALLETNFSSSQQNGIIEPLTGLRLGNCC